MISQSSEYPKSTLMPFENLWLAHPDLLLGVLAILDFILLLYAVLNIEVLFPADPTIIQNQAEIPANIPTEESTKLEVQAIGEFPPEIPQEIAKPEVPLPENFPTKLPQENTQIDVPLFAPPPVQYPSPFADNLPPPRIPSTPSLRPSFDTSRLAMGLFAALVVCLIGFGIYRKVSATKVASQNTQEIVAINGVTVDNEQKLREVQAQALKQSQRNPASTTEISIKAEDGTVKKKQVKALRD
jgi:hypothetical protein